MNKNGDSATMYKTIPAVAGLNKVEGFDPSSLLVNTISPATGNEGLQLGLAYKKLWFRLAYPEGRLQTEKVSLTEQMGVFEARVYLHYGDANPVSSFVSGCVRGNAPGGRYIQEAQDQAMDAALTDAGFGLQFADVCTDGSMAGEGEKPAPSGAGDVATEKNPARNAGTAGTAAPSGNTVHAGNVVRPFPGTAADGGMKKAPMPGTQPFGARQPVQTAAMLQGQSAPAGTGQPVRTAAMPQSQGRQPAGAGQPNHTASMPQSQGRQPAGTRQSVQTAAIPQGQTTPPAGARQPAQKAMPQGQKVQPATVPQGKVSSAAGTGQPISSAESQGQGTELVGARQGIPPVLAQKQETLPAGSGQPAQSVMPQDKGAQSAGKKKLGMPAMPQSQPPHHPVVAKPAVPQEQSGQLPVPPASPENKGTVQAVADAASGSTDSLPVPPMGKGGQTDAEPAAAADALPVPAGSPGKDESRSSVLEAIALLNGQALPAGTSEGMAGEGNGSTAGTANGNGAAASMEAVSPEGDLPVNRETAQGGPVPRYTPDMSVEEIVSLMTLEEAGKVVVDTGVSKGQTIAEVAERRPPSLKFYRYGGYKGPNNILRAAAQIMLDSIEGQKAS